MMQPGPWLVHEEECAIERWDDPSRGPVRWRTLLSGDRTPTEALTVGVAELPPEDGGAGRAHRHAQAEVYFVLSGQGVVSISGTEHPLRPGAAVFIPGNAEHLARNTGAEPLRLLYVFAADSFDQVRYEFAEA